MKPIVLLAVGEDFADDARGRVVIVEGAGGGQSENEGERYQADCNG
jgi:hypothetical protein